MLSPPLLPLRARADFQRSHLSSSVPFPLLPLQICENKISLGAAVPGGHTC